MLKKLTLDDIRQIAKIHKSELPGFLSELGIPFLENFYKTSLTIPEMFTLVEKENEQILGFVTCTTSTKELYKKVISKDILGFGVVFLRYFSTHPGKLVKLVKLASYPGFAGDTPELLSIAVDRRHQKKGIGRRLFEAGVTELRKRGIRQFKVSAYERLPANGFYLKMGCRLDRSFPFLGEKMNYYVYKIK